MTSAVMDELDMRMLAVQGVVEEVVKIHYEVKEKMDKNDSALMDRLTEFRRIVERTTDQEKEYKLLRTEFIKGAISEADFKKSATPFLDSMDANKTRIEEINKTYFRK